MAHRKYRVHHHRHHHRNPFGFSQGTFERAMWGTGGAVGALAVPAMLAPTYNTSWTGYLLNAASAYGLKILADAVKGDGDAVFAGGLISTGLRIVREQVGSKIPGLSAYWPSSFAVPTVSNPYGQTLVSPYPAPALPAPVKGMSGGRFTGGRFRRMVM
jgi:hypothetical protein